MTRNDELGEGAELESADCMMCGGYLDKLGSGYLDTGLAAGGVVGEL